MCQCDELTTLNYHAHKLLTTILSLTNYCQEVFRPRLKFPGWAMPTLIFSRVGACPPCSPRAGAHALHQLGSNNFAVNLYRRITKFSQDSAAANLREVQSLIPASFAVQFWIQQWMNCHIQATLSKLSQNNSGTLFIDPLCLVVDVIARWTRRKKQDFFCRVTAYFFAKCVSSQRTDPSNNISSNEVAAIQYIVGDANKPGH